MMDGILLSVVLFASCVGPSQDVDANCATTEPAALAVNLANDEVPALRLPSVLPAEAARPTWQRMAARTAQARPANRSSKAARVLGIALGGFGGFMAGGAIGYSVASKPDTDDDGVSGLRGVVIGAPIGAVVGAVIGYGLTK
jgi:hypothetical protein